jgi:TRAP transporter TAXI family solute receptor
VRRALASAAAALCLAGCGAGGDEAQPEREPLAIATGGKGGIYSVYGANHARRITRDLPGYRGTTQATTGSVENLQRLRDGEVQIALTLADTALDAVEGREAFERPVPIRALAQIYPSYVQLVTRAGSPIRSLEDLAGKRVGIGAPDSGTQVVAERVLDVAGLDPRRDLEPRELGVAESARALRDGSVDAFFWSGGVPTAAVTALAAEEPVALVPLGRFTRPMRTRWGGVYERAAMPAGAYAGVDAPVQTVSIPNYVLVDEHMNPVLAQDLTELLLSSATAAERARAPRVIAPVGLHPGAERHYARGGG